MAVAHSRGFEVAWRWAETGTIPPCRDDEAYAVAIPELKWLHHIPNGGGRGDSAKSAMIRGGQLKAEGVKAGVADLFLPVRRGQWPGLYIEMKKPAVKAKKEGILGGVSDEQKQFGDFVMAQGYGWMVCYSWREAAQAIEQYLNCGQ